MFCSIADLKPKPFYKTLYKHLVFLENRNLYILTTGFPVLPKSEPYLLAEISVLKQHFKNIYFIPITDTPEQSYEGELNIIRYKVEDTAIPSLFFIFSQVSDDLWAILKRVRKLRSLRYYLADIRKTFQKALAIEKIITSPSNSNPQLIYAYWSNECATIAAILKSRSEKPIALSRAHGFDVFEEQTKDGIIPFREFQLTHLDKIFSVSKQGENHLKKMNPLFNDKISHSYLGSVKPATFNPFDPSEFNLVTCCFIRGIKRLSLFPEILKHISFKAKWFVIGGGDENEIELIKRNTQSLPTNIEVIFLGHFNETELHHFYETQSLNLMVSLSSSEGLPYSMMEAISYGIPLLSTDVGGCKEICTSETGILIDKTFEPKNVAELISKFRNSEKNALPFRENVRKFWHKNFYAEANYSEFSKQILEL